MWISKPAYNLLQSSLSEAHREIDRLHELIAVIRAHSDERLRDKDSLITTQESRLAVLELERRELTQIFIDREKERQRPPAQIASLDQFDWNSILQAQIDELNTQDSPQ